MSHYESYVKRLLYHPEFVLAGSCISGSLAAEMMKGETSPSCFQLRSLLQFIDILPHNVMTAFLSMMSHIACFIVKWWL